MNMVDIIPKQSSQLGFRSTFFYAGLMALILVLGAFFALQYMQVKAAEALNALEIEINSSKTPDSRRLESRMKTYESKIGDFSGLMQARKNSLPVFSFLEQHTHPGVAFASFGLDIEKRSLELSGTTQDFTTLDSQIAIFKQQKEVESFELSSLSLRQDGQVSFSFSITLASLLLQ
ncbi:MAG: hypothetical protein HYT50_01715 [Candidatus Wildermuthbacteria bacterium]|nr:hypothetical protein [Candidatus Wildermuthbacteria bacterium]